MQAFERFLVQSDYNRSLSRKKEPGDIWFYPSSIGQCPRKIVYGMLSYPGEPKEMEDILVLDNGTYFHERMEDYFEKMGILVTREMAFRDIEHSISGRSDAIIYDPAFDPEKDDPGETIELIDRDGNKLYEGPANALSIIEFKSIKESNFDKLKTVAKKNHVQQLQLYLHLTKIPKGQVWYENKNNQSPLTFEYAYNPEIAAQVLEEIDGYVDMAKREELPERPYKPHELPCRWCQYRDTCHPNTNPFDYDQLFNQEEFPF